MSVLRLGSLSRLLREQVAPGTGLCLSCRRVLDRGRLLGSAQPFSSAKPKDEMGAGERCRLELVEVLQTRVQQLQADETSPPHASQSKKILPEEVPGKGEDNQKTLQTPKRWMEKLKNEQMAKHQKQQALNGGTEKGEADRAPGKPAKKPRKNSAEKRPTTSRDLPDNKDTEATVQGNGLVLEDKDGNRYGGAQRTIHCYLETCIFLGEVIRAQNCLQYYHQHISRRGLLNISMYNLLMRAWAKEASISQIGRLFVMLGETALKPNLGSYAAALEALGRTESNTKAIERCLKQMEESGMSAEELFQGLLYVEDEREMVLAAIQRVKPDFTPPPKAQIVCSSPLVADFYSKEPPPSYPKMGFAVSDLRQRFEEQLKIESCETVTINSVEAGKPVHEERTKAREALDALRSGWRKDLLNAFRDSKNHLAEISRKSRRISLYPYLCLLDEQHYVDIMLQTLSKIPPTGESFLLLSQELGSKIYNRFSIRRQLQGSHMERIRYLYDEYCHLLAKDGRISRLLPRELWENLEHEKFGGSCSPSAHCLWPRSLVVQLGTHLVELMVQTIKLRNNTFSPRSEAKLIPVLYHMYSFRSTRQIGLIKPHPIYSQILLDAGETLLTFETAVMPMRCPPLPWTSPHFGAYLLSPAKLMRCSEGALQHQLLLDKSAPGQLFPVLDSLNQLGICAWRINQPVLDIIVSIFNDKGSDKLDIPPPLSEAPALPVQAPGAQSSWEKLSYQKEQARCRKKAAEMYSLRMDALYKLSIANHLRDRIFWFPHNMDFRGRTYPCPPYFNHLGSDVTRALLLFAEGRPLGPNGLDWLKTHLINLTGLKKKSSLQERKRYADEIMDDILDSADRPLTGRKWWMEADEPWQTLACCIEVTNASRSPDPTEYVSYFPVHQDGSCNGLQHYAALGRDEIGARSVNLMPSETPQDVYSGVAQQVEEFRKIDAKKGIKIAQVLEGFIGRKVVKQTVMTVVYGVTRYGGRLQIEKRLRELDSFPQEYVWEASHYLVQQVFSSLKEMFSGTRSIQHWLTESARMISKSGNTVEWVTPLGLPIIQPYHRSRSVMFQSNLQAVYMINRNDANERPDTMKQKNAFPPNFIHSLDSTHMMLTALHCHRRGLTFVSVHDCFWTHADTVDMMNKVCREQFVSLHSQPILQNLSQFLIQKYCHNAQSHNAESRKMQTLFQDVPETGTFDLDHVKHSTYFFS